MVKDYREIILSQNVLNQAIEELKLEMTPAELAKKVSVAVPTDTRILSITASAVSYTHLDVYKRQLYFISEVRAYLLEQGKNPL